MKRLVFLVAALLVVTLYGGALAENFNVSSISDLRDALGQALTSDEEDTINIAAGTYAVSDPLYFWAPVL